MPIIHIHRPDPESPEGRFYVPKDENRTQSSLLTGLIMRKATLTVYPGGYMGDITPGDWHSGNAHGSFWIDVENEGEAATISFVPFGRRAPDIDTSRATQFDGPVTATRTFEIHASKCMAISRPTQSGVEIGGLVMHATHTALDQMEHQYFNNRG